MTARLVSLSPNFNASVTSWLSQQSQRQALRCVPSSSPAKEGFNQKAKARDQSSDDNRGAIAEDALWSALLESMPIGVLVLTTLLQLVYANDKAIGICERLEKSNSPLPIAVIALCQRMIGEDEPIAEPLVMEYQEQSEQFFRLQARWLCANAEAQPLLLVQIEDCLATLYEELALEQQKYDLTDREAEVWVLLRQDYSYQQISERLNISLNTVKTHVKNVYSKRKNAPPERRIWYSR